MATPVPIPAEPPGLLVPDTFSKAATALTLNIFQFTTKPEAVNAGQEDLVERLAKVFAEDCSC